MREIDRDGENDLIPVIVKVCIRSCIPWDTTKTLQVLDVFTVMWVGSCSEMKFVGQKARTYFQ